MKIMALKALHHIGLVFSDRLSAWALEKIRQEAHRLIKKKIGPELYRFVFHPETFIGEKEK